MRSLLVVVLVAGAAAGCALRNSGDLQHHYVLGAVSAAPAASAPRHKATLLVGETTAAAFYDTQQIVYSRSAETRSYYQLNSWTEVPSRRLGELLLTQLDRSEAFAGVVSAASGIRGNLVLSTHLEEIYHDASTRPGSATVVLRAELSDPVRRVLIGRRTFTAAVPVASYDAAGAVQGLGVATAQVVQEVAAWVVALGANQPE